MNHQLSSKYELIACNQIPADFMSLLTDRISLLYTNNKVDITL